MIIRAGTGWQYALADLSLILFLTTASALSLSLSRKANPPMPPALPPPPIAAALESAPVAVWSAGHGAPRLAQWLAQAGGDPRMEVRVVVRYGPGRRDAAIMQALQLVDAGGARARDARILVEPGERAGASVALYYASESGGRGRAALAR